MLAVALAFALLAGCADNRTYQVAVRNESGGPVTVGLAKEGGKFERHWATPEEVVIRTTSDDERGWDSVVVPPGDVRSAGPVKGDFARGAAAILRVYQGDLELSDVLAISRRSPSRVDVPLEPGRNAIIVREEKGRLTYERVKLPPAR
jgi:hypothetical protein